MVKTKPFINASQQESGEELSPSQRIMEKKREMLRERKMKAQCEKILNDAMVRAVSHTSSAEKFTVAAVSNDKVSPAVKKIFEEVFPNEKATVIGIKSLGKGVYRSKTKRAATKYNYSFFYR